MAARLLTPTDAHRVMNALVQQATGKTDLVATDTSTFVSVGETVLSTGFENVLGALSIVLGKTLVAVKPYNAKITLIQEENTGLYTSRFRKISFYDRGAKAAGFVNTDLYPKNLYDGYSNGAADGAVGSQWEQEKPIAVELNFSGSDVWDFQLTCYKDDIKRAFRNEDEFIAFWNGMITAKMNDIEQTKEEFNRMNLVNYMGGLLAMNMPGCVVNLTKEFNDKYGTSYTNEELRGEQVQKFLMYTAFRIRQMSDFMTERTKLYHWSPNKTVDGVTYNTILRHTPKADQRMFYFKPLFEEAKAMVFPEIFNPQYIPEQNGEGVTYWQAINEDGGINNGRMKINVKPAIPNIANPAEQTTPNAAVEAEVVAVLFDKDALITNFQHESSDATELEARKRYWNLWFHNMKNAVNDFTENGIIFVMDDSYLTAGA